MKQLTVKTRTNKFTETIVNNTEGTQNTVKLNPRVEHIHLADPDTSEEQKQQLIHLMNKYDMCFASNNGPG